MKLLLLKRKKPLYIRIKEQLLTYKLKDIDNVDHVYEFLSKEIDIIKKSYLTYKQ